MYSPQRMCVSCRKRCSKDELIRISKNQNGPVVDQNKNEKSRAIYVCKQEKCIKILKKSKAIERFLKISADDSFYEKLKFEEK